VATFRKFFMPLRKPVVSEEAGTMLRRVCTVWMAPAASTPLSFRPLRPAVVQHMATAQVSMEQKR
jgi:hypothetical protein